MYPFGVSLHLFVCMISFQPSDGENESLRRQTLELQKVNVQVDVDRGEMLRFKLVGSIKKLRFKTIDQSNSKLNWSPVKCLVEITRELLRPRPDYETLNRVSKCFYGAKKCFHQAEYLAVRDDLRAYVYWLRTSTQNNPAEYQKAYESHLQKIADELAAHPSNPDLAAMAQSFNWLVHSGHARPLVANFRKKFSSAAALIDVNPNLGQLAIERFEKKINESKFTQNQIIGANVSGVSHFTGTIKAKLLNDDNRATLRVYLQDGVIRTNDSVGTKQIPLLNGTVAVNGSATTIVEQAHVDIHFDGKKVVAGNPVVRCSTESRIHGVDFSRQYLLPPVKFIRQRLGLGPDLLEQLVQNQAGLASQKQKHQAELESSDIAAQNISNSIKAELTANLKEISSKIEKEISEVIEPTFIRHGIYFDGIASRSSSNRVRVAFDKCGIGGCGAPLPRVSHSQRMDAAMEIMIHESSFMNFFTEVASGADWNDAHWAYIQKTLSGFNSFSFLIGTRKRWSCQMDWDAPISLRLEDDCMTFNFRIQNFIIDGKKYSNPFVVSASYRPSIEHYGVDLKRVGDVRVDWENGAPEDESCQKFIHDTFEDLLQQKQHWDSLIIPYGGAWGDMDKLRLSSFTIKDGWFVAEVSPNKHESPSFVIGN